MDWNILVSIIALCFSIAAIIVVYPRVTLEIDYLGLIVGMLSFLITLLMGWNIYTLVDFKGKIKGIGERENELKEGIEKLSKKENIMTGYTHDVIANTYLSLIEGDIDKSVYLSEKYLALISYAIVSEVKKCNQIADEMIAYIRSDYGDNIHIEAYRYMYDILRNVKNASDIEGIHKLISIIYQKFPEE